MFFFLKIYFKLSTFTVIRRLLRECSLNQSIHKTNFRMYDEMIFLIDIFLQEFAMIILILCKMSNSFRTMTAFVKMIYLLKLTVDFSRSDRNCCISISIIISFQQFSELFQCNDSDLLQWLNCAKINQVQQFNVEFPQLFGSSSRGKTKTMWRNTSK